MKQQKFGGGGEMVNGKKNEGGKENLKSQSHFDDEHFFVNSLQIVKSGS